MTKLLLGALASTLILAGCATTGTTTQTAQTVGQTANSIGTGLLKTAIDQQCRVQLNNYQAYKLATLMLGETQKSTLENKVCGCVSEKAPEQVSLTEIGQAVIDPTARAQIATTAVSKTLSACAQEFFSF